VGTGGSLVVAGTSQRSSSGLDIWIRSYDATGVSTWDFFWTGPGDARDTAYDLVVTPSGDVILGGLTSNATTQEDALVLMVEAGAERAAWAYVMDGSGSGLKVTDDTDVVRTLIIASDGNLVVGGQRAVTDESLNGWLAMLSASGEVIWESEVSDDAGDRGTILDLAAGSDQTILALHLRFGAVDTECELFVFSELDGELLDEWVLDSDGCGAIVPHSDALFALSSTDLSGMTAEIYSDSLELEWLGHGPSGQNSSLASVDAGVVLAGWSSHTMHTDAWVGGFARGGQLVWSDGFGEPDADEGWNAVAVLPDGDIVVAGEIRPHRGDSDGIVRRYHPASP